MSEAKTYSQAELRRLKQLASEANAAIVAHSSFVEFLREQHDAPEEAGWEMTATGFEMKTVPDEPAPPIE